MLHYRLTTPLGDLLLLGDERGLTAIQLPGLHDLPPASTESSRPFADAIGQLSEYFEGRRRTFGLRLAPVGGGFDRAVWDRIAEIPYGQTVSYGRVAADIGKPDHARAVGASNARNPLPIVVPCHRVVGSDGSLTGYAGGLDQKRELLSLESGGWQQRLV
jgi:methylated-DNA-[protein]-cysteine S-methyltransferase